MKAIICKVGEPAYVGEINGYEQMKEVVGGWIESIYPYEDEVALVCNEEGKIKSLPLNRFLHDERGKLLDVICGDFFLCGVGEEDFIDIPEELVDKYKEIMDNEMMFLSVSANYRK